MIRITPKEKFHKGFTIEGHSEFAEKGYDIICASISALAQSVLMTLHDYTHVTYKMYDGYLDVDIHVSLHETRAITHVLEVGVKQLAKQYPDHITIEEEETKTK